MARTALIVSKVPEDDAYFHRTLQHILSEQIPVRHVYIFVSREEYPNGTLNNRDAEDTINSHKIIKKIEYEEKPFLRALYDNIPSRPLNIVYFPSGQDYGEASLEKLYDTFLDYITGQSVIFTDMGLDNENKGIYANDRPVKNTTISTCGISIYPPSVFEKQYDIPDEIHKYMDLQLSLLSWYSQIPVMVRGDITSRKWKNDWFQRDKQWESAKNVIIQKTMSSTVNRTRNTRTRRRQSSRAQTAVPQEENQPVETRQAPSSTAPPRRTRRVPRSTVNQPVSTPREERNELPTREIEEIAAPQPTRKRSRRTRQRGTANSKTENVNVKNDDIDDELPLPPDRQPAPQPAQRRSRRTRRGAANNEKTQRSTAPKEEDEEFDDGPPPQLQAALPVRRNRRTRRSSSASTKKKGDEDLFDDIEIPFEDNSEIVFNVGDNMIVDEEEPTEEQDMQQTTEEQTTEEQDMWQQQSVEDKDIQQQSVKREFAEQDVQQQSVEGEFVEKESAEKQNMWQQQPVEKESSEKLCKEEDVQQQHVEEEFVEKESAEQQPVEKNYAEKPVSTKSKKKGKKKNKTENEDIIDIS